MAKEEDVVEKIGVLVSERFYSQPQSTVSAENDK